ncbi:MAG: bile acid:sodium symporter family protein [Negativicoccus succinicivorans]|uniref:bile acid:sodium symporter family protein n=1 Tax=Negativicoccus succinicivorans TaxID=620903 RepID=UPI0026EB5E0F|nr:bile acid:sodium symporter family protein [Negativicoccus succinicivorans]MBS6027830.1 bile acid:sodium symporter family protein [Negativicoccus succinicivorans]
MKTIVKITGALTRYIGAVIIIFTAWAFLQPELFGWAVQYTAWFLGAAMFGMGLSIHAEDFAVVFARPREVLLGVALQYTVMPVAAWALAAGLGLPTDLALGVILVGCCPGGTASNVITYIAGGDVALSVGMTIVSTLLAPLATPLLVFGLAGAWVNVSLWAMITSVVKVVLIPVLLGLLLHTLFRSKIKPVQDVFPLVSVAAIVFIIAGIVAVNREKVLTSGLIVIGLVAIHNMVGLGLGYLAARQAKASYAKTTAIAIEVGMQNSGLAIALATANFAANPLATLPGAIFSVWHNISGSLFASYRRREEPDTAKDSVEQLPWETE